MTPFTFKKGLETLWVCFDYLHLNSLVMTCFPGKTKLPLV